MRILDATWTPVVNMLLIECGDCPPITHRADRWWVSCPNCSAREHLGELRERYLEDAQCKGCTAADDADLETERENRVDLKDHQIIAQNAGTAAAAIIAAEIRAGVMPHWDAERFEGIRTAIYVGVIDIVQLAAPAVVEQAFQPQPLANVVPIGTPAANLAAAVGQAPGYPQPQQAPAYPQQPQYAPQAGGPPVPPGMAQTPPPAPQAAAGGAPAACPACGSRIYDNRNDNARRRQNGFKLGPDLKCSNRNCNGGSNGRGWVTFPGDYQQYANLPQEPRS